MPSFAKSLSFLWVVLAFAGCGKRALDATGRGDRDGGVDGSSDLRGTGGSQPDAGLGPEVGTNRDVGADLSVGDDAPVGVDAQVGGDARDAGADGGGAHVSSPVAYEVHGTLKIAGTPPFPAGLSLPTTQDFVLYVDPVRQALMAGSAGASTSSSVVVDGATFRASGHVRLGLAPCGPSFDYDAFSFTASTDGVEGKAKGTVSLRQGDQSFIGDAEMTFQGSLDRHGPMLPSLPTGLDPLTGFTVMASEPLAPEVGARLVAAGDDVALPTIKDNGIDIAAVLGFSMAPDRALLYGAHYRFELDPWRDLAGNAGSVPPFFDTAPLPALTPQDGFESATASDDGPVLVDAAKIPPISGARSAAVVANASLLAPLPVDVEVRPLTLRLAVPPGATRIRFKIRPFAATLSAASAARAIVAIPGGLIASTVFSEFGEQLDTTVVLANGATVQMGETRTLDRWLPPNAPGEVIFAVRNPSTVSACQGLPSPQASYLVDDVEVY